MTRSKKDEDQLEPSEATAKPRRYRFDCSTKQLFFCCSGLILALSWMFVLGILVGRGIPLVQSGDTSVRGELMRFLGLGREAPQPVENAAETWDNPKKMLESLNYYEDLTQKSSPLPSKPSVPAPSAPLAKKPAAESQDQKPKPAPALPAPAQATASPQAEKPLPKAAPQESGPPENSSEHFTLLISSLRDTENAQRLVEQLKSKGYPTRLETLDLSGSGRWNRVLIGSFQNKAEALRFAADFNRKERMEGLVIRESR